VTFDAKESARRMVAKRYATTMTGTWCRPVPPLGTLRASGAILGTLARHARWHPATAL
jgi:hypothetical protein